MPEAVPTLLCLSEQDQMMGAALLEMLGTQGLQFTARALSQYTELEQLFMLAIMGHLAPSGNVLSVNGLGWSVLDSGSSRHIHPDAVITDSDHSVSLTGFDHSQQWTSGSGYLPVCFLSRETGSRVAHDITGVDVMKGLVHPILSMGRLIQQVL
jgi:hypothetical protein